MRSGLAMMLRSSFAKVTAQHADRGRREFIKKSALATLAMALPLAACTGNKIPRIAIIGGGIAGLTTSLYLTRMGIEHIVYEGSGRLGGRILTVPDAVIEGAHIDFGAEFIDSIHEDVLNLAKELNVELVDLQQDKLIAKAYHFDGKMYTENDIVNALQPFAEKLVADIGRIPGDLHYSNSNLYKDLDEHSIVSYLISIGIQGWLLSFFGMAMEGEYAMNASEQSAMNLLLMLSVPLEYNAHYHLFGNYHEVFKFKGGSQRFIDALSAKTEKQVKVSHRLLQISQLDKQYRLSFETPEGAKDIIADYVVLAIPIPVIRDVNRDFQFSARKEKWIAEAGFGNAIKVGMGFKKRVWREAGYQGYTFTDVNRTVFWDSAQMTDLQEGSLTFAGGGDSAEALIKKSYTEIESIWLQGANAIFPGLTENYNGKISKFPWKLNPFSKGSYTSYKKGQWSEFSGVEAESFENILFAGEHCSIRHQGFMNGAAETGKLAAQRLQELMQKAKV